MPSNTSSVSAQASNQGMYISWPAVSGASSYKIERATNGGAFVALYSTSATSYTDNTVANGTSYQYRISSVNSAGTSDGTLSNTVTFNAIAAPVAPFYVSTMDMSGNVSVSWPDVAGASSYKVERKSDNGAYVVIGTVAVSDFTDMAVPDGKYTYRVSAINSYGTSAPTESTPVLFVGGESKYMANAILGNWVLHYTDTTDHTLNLKFSAIELAPNSVIVYRAIGQDSSGNVFRVLYDTSSDKYILGGNFSTPQEIYFTFAAPSATGAIAGTYWLSSDTATVRAFTGQKQP